MKRAYRFRFYPTDEQANQLARTFGCVRVSWNHALRYRSDRWRDEAESTNFGQCSAELTALKQDPEFNWLNEVASVPLQQTLRHQQIAFRSFFEGRGGYPKLKSRRGTQAAAYTKSAFRYDPAAQTLKLAKMAEPLPIRWSRTLPKGVVPSTVTVTRDAADRFHVSMLVDETIQPLPIRTEAVGIDLGLTSLATLSNGHKIPNPRHLNRDLAKLANAQRLMARKQKGSNNRAKARRRVARTHARVADRRRDHLHKLTTRLIRENQTIAVETLSTSEMTRNRRLARHIGDAGWGELVRQLEYKADWYGRTLVKVDRWFPSSKLCSNCGHLIDSLPLNIRSWQCSKCNSIHDRDVNAAINILSAGLAAVNACGDDVRPAVLSGTGAVVCESGIPNE